MIYCPLKRLPGKSIPPVSARRNEDFVVIARTEALIAGLGQEEALQRARAYEEAGADCILLHSKSKSASEVVQCLRAWTGKARFVLVPTNYPDLIEPVIDELARLPWSFTAIKRCVRR